MSCSASAGRGGARRAGPRGEALAALTTRRGRRHGGGSPAERGALRLRGARRDRARHSEQPAPGAGWPRPAYPWRRSFHPAIRRSRRSRPSPRSSPTWAGSEADRIVFAHTHQPLAGVRSRRDARIRYWNTGSWIYEPDLGSRQAYARYCRYAWPGTAVLIDGDERAPRLVEMLADLNPLNGGAGLPAEPQGGGNV